MARKEIWRESKALRNYAFLRALLSTNGWPTLFANNRSQERNRCSDVQQASRTCLLRYAGHSHA